MLVDRSGLWKGGPVKMLTEGKQVGWTQQRRIRITTRHIGGGHKQSYRLVDFAAASTTCRRWWNGSSTTRTAPPSSPSSSTRTASSPTSWRRSGSPPATASAGAKVDVKPGNAMPLSAMPIGTIVHNVEMKPGRGGQIARSAGSFVQLVGRDAGWAVLKLNSGETRRVRADCMATVGAVLEPRPLQPGHGQGRPHALAGPPPDGALDHEPGRSPQRRPHQGRQALGHALGKPTKGFKTRKNKATDKYIVRSRQLKK